MKHVKTYENNSSTKLDSFINQKNEIYKTISEFFKEYYQEDIEIFDIRFIDDENEPVEIDFYYSKIGDNDSANISKEVYEEMVKYVENPELYKNTKKYNL